MKILLVKILLFILAMPGQCQEFVLVSETSQKKFYYEITRKALEANRSKAELFGDAQPSIQKLITKAKKHINLEQVSAVAPSLTWPPEDYNKGREFPIYSGDLSFFKIELKSYGEYRYWVLHFRLLGPIGSASHETKVVCFLNGHIPRLVEKEDVKEPVKK